MDIPRVGRFEKVRLVPCARRPLIFPEDSLDVLSPTFSLEVSRLASNKQDYRRL